MAVATAAERRSVRAPRVVDERFDRLRDDSSERDAQGGRRRPSGALTRRVLPSGV